MEPSLRVHLLRDYAETVLPAADLYTGTHHQMVMATVTRLRREAPDARVGVAIVSAGFGVLDENDPVFPYQATFNGLTREETIRRGRNLGLRRALSHRLADYESAIFLLGREYLTAIEAPFSSAARELYLTAHSVCLLGRGVVSITASNEQARRLRVSPRLIKAVMFGHFVDTLLGAGWDPAVQRLRGMLA